MEEGNLAISIVRASKTRLPTGPVDGEAMLRLGRAGTGDALEWLRRYSPEGVPAY